MKENQGTPVASTQDFFNFFITTMEDIQKATEALRREAEITNKVGDCGKFLSAAIQSLEAANVFLRNAMEVQAVPLLANEKSVEGQIRLSKIIQTLPQIQKK